MITGATRLLALAGSPVAHSLSPMLHNRFATDAGLDYAYLAFNVAPDDLGEFVRAAKTLNIAGFNLTMPHKERVLPHLDAVDETARIYGAVNTVVNRDGKLHGYNTDGDGFVMSLERNGFSAWDGNALILGAGGAARAVAIALLGRGMRVTLAVRRAGLPPVHENAAYCAWETIAAATRTCNLLVNATPLGMHGHGAFGDLTFLASLPEHAFVCDLVYAPRETALVKEATRLGLRAENGLPLLVYQAALAFGLFTGTQPSESCVNAILHELQ